MERRLFVFFVLSLLIWTGFLALQFVFSPPPKPAGNAAKPAVAKAEEKKNAESKADEKNSAEKKEDAKRADTADVSTEPVAADVAKIAPKFVTLGSLDPASGYTMLVTLDNRGAAVKRVELNHPRYHNLDDDSGYLGHLELTTAKQGCQIQVVGPGTPASLARAESGETGLAVNDLILAVNETPVKTVTEFETYLQKQSKPLQEMRLTVLRKTAEQETKLQFVVKLTRPPLELIRPELNAKAKSLSPNHPWGNVGAPSFRTTLTKLDTAQIDPTAEEIDTLPSLFNDAWEVASGGTDTAEFRHDVKYGAGEQTGTLQMVKRYRLEKSKVAGEASDYHLRYEIEFSNPSARPLSLAYRQEGPRGVPVEGWWYSTKLGPGWGAVGARDVAYFDDSHRLAGGPEIISNADKQMKAENPPTLDLLLGKTDKQFAYLAVDTQFFASALLPAASLSENTGNLPKFSVASAVAWPLNKVDDKYWKKTTDVTFRFDSEVLEIAPQSKMTHEYVIFAGPKQPEVLAKYGLDRMIEYGWFKTVAVILGKFLHLLHYLTGNYGVAIILLTVVVRMCLMPLGLKQAKSAALMQQLSPELQKIKEKYANNMEEQAKAQRELFAKNGFNPMGGCFLMFLQLPIFIGLYRCLSVDIELREAALLSNVAWCSNLAGPDKLLNWSDWMWPYFSDPGAGWLGPFFNVLPLITIVLFVIQQKMFSPPATDEETKMQQNIMMFMTCFMGVMFYKVPAGLCIYFITSSIWGIAERKLLPKPTLGSTTVVSAGPAEPTEEKEKGERQVPGAGLLDKLLNLADNELKSSKRNLKK